MGMFDGNHSSKCTCPHCRGGHIFSSSIENDNQVHQHVDIDESVFEVSVIDGDALLNDYIELVLECSSEDEVVEVMESFFQHVATYTIQELYLADIKAKIDALNEIKNRMNQ